MPEDLARFIYIVGPTGIGKSNLAMALAESFHLPILNCDSIQVYTELDIGSAKPTLDDRKRVPHYLVDYVKPPQQLTVGDYLRDVEKTVQDHRITQALIVGGSGFYVRALEKGVYPGSTPSPAVKEEVSQWIATEGYESLYQWIQERDPGFGQKLKSNDHYRIRRTVELMRSQNRSMTELKQLMETENHSILPKNCSIKIGLKEDREKIRQIVYRRTEAMLRAGLIDEVSALVQQGWSEWAPLQSVGYKEVQQFLRGEIAREQLQDQIVTSTMQLVKKQMTWFKADTQIHWFHPSQTNEIASFVNSWILTGESNRVL